MGSDRLALYTTVYPGVERYLSGWYKSVIAQTDKNFDIWIGVDALAPELVLAALGAEPCAVRLLSAKGETPAQIRQRAMELLARAYPAVVFVDSDDLLYPSRVAAAREALRQHDVSACALRIMNEEGHDLGIVFAPPAGQTMDTLLPTHNVFGLSNTAYRSDVLRRCLPLPAECELVDWLLATRAWATGGALNFDYTPHMAYRQYAANVAEVLPPFSAAQVLRATDRVGRHYRCLLTPGRELPNAHRRVLQVARDRVEEFSQAVTGSAFKLDAYVRALNQMLPQYVWWWCVAHPALENVWKN